MRFKILSLFAALVLVAACETAPQETADSSAGSDSSNSSASSSSGSAASSDSGTVGSVVPGSVRDFNVNVGARAFFGFDRSDLSDDAQAVLAKQAAWLLQYPAITIQVEGHADERGTDDYNMGLGQRRANSAREYLVSLGVSADRITIISYGKRRPEAGGSNEEAWAQNRRSFTRITGGSNS